VRSIQSQWSCCWRLTQVYTVILVDIMYVFSNTVPLAARCDHYSILLAAMRCFRFQRWLNSACCLAETVPTHSLMEQAGESPGRTLHEDLLLLTSDDDQLVDETLLRALVDAVVSQPPPVEEVDGGKGQEAEDGGLLQYVAEVLQERLRNPSLHTKGKSLFVLSFLADRSAAFVAAIQTSVPGIIDTLQASMDGLDEGIAAAAAATATAGEGGAPTAEQCAARAVRETRDKLLLQLGVVPKSMLLFANTRARLASGLTIVGRGWVWHAPQSTSVSRVG
jgi:hypothetical protein